MKRLFIIYLLLTIHAIPSTSQDGHDVENELRLINNIYHSDSTEFLFNLDKIPKELIKKMQKLADSIASQRPTTNFIADRNEEWRATDFEPNKTKNSPTRKFLFGISKDDTIVLFYWHGGRGKHIHLVMFIKEQMDKPTSFTTLNNWDIFNELDHKDRIKKIKSKELEPFANVDDIAILRGQLKRNYEVF